MTPKKRVVVLADLRKIRDTMLKVHDDLDDGNNTEAQKYILNVINQIEVLIDALNRF